ncbi:MAG: ABC transporter substrate-binding protein [Polyangiaceae bacterium]
MRFRWLVPVLLVVASLVVSAPARADDAQSFIQQQHAKLEQLLRQPDSEARTAQINRSLDNFVDYDALTKRAFGEPCPSSVPACDNLWSGYADEERQTLRDLLTRLVRKNYRKNLVKTLDYEITYRGTRDSGGDARVMTEAKNKNNPRETSVRVDYVVAHTASGYRVVDIITEGSSLTKNYYEQFRKKMKTPGEGYPNIVQKLEDKVNRAD